MNPGSDLRVTMGIAAVGALAVPLAVVAGSCAAPVTASPCQLGPVSAYEPSPLMLSREARLDRVPDGFFLFAVDKPMNVLRWVHIDNQRLAGKEQQVMLPANRRGGPWFAAAGRAAAGDTILIAYGLPAGNATDLEIKVLAIPADNPAAPATESTVATITGGALPDAHPAVVLASSASGMRAGLGFTAKATATEQGTVMAAVLGGDGKRVGEAVMVDDAQQADCLAFIPGKSDLSLTYYRFRSPTLGPDWVVAELRESPRLEGTLSLLLATEQPGCPLALATPTGYALAWQHEGGSRLGYYTSPDNRFQDHLFVSAVEFGGPKLQPPLVGLGLAGPDIEVIFAQPGAGEVWRVTADGKRVPGTLLLPSQKGDLGSISSVAVSGSLISTYADFGSPNQRYLLETSCF